MEVIVFHHNIGGRDNPHEYDEQNMKEIFRIELPQDISLHCDFMDCIILQDERLLVYLKDMPGRIDFDSYLNSMHILNREEGKCFRKPFCLIPHQEHLSSTLWELGEREQTTFVEVGETVI